MDTLERAIRSALEKGDAGERSFREKVYKSAFAALERALANPSITPEDAATRRANLQQTIARVEGEYLAAGQGVPAGRAAAAPASHQQTAPLAETDFVPERRPTSNAPTTRTDPDFVASRSEPELSTEPVQPHYDEYSIDADLDENVRGESRTVRRQKKRFGWWLIATTLLTLVILAAWWSYSSGLFGAGNISGSNSSVIREAEDFDPGTPSARRGSAAPRADHPGLEENAVSLFTPADQEDVTVPGDATAEVSGEGDNQTLRIRSGRSGSAVAFNVPQDILAGLAGKRALFLIEAQAEEGDQTQISISCAFGEQGDCGGRRRFDLSSERGEILFDVELPDVQPGADGTIAIVSDVSNQGKAAEIFSISVTPN